MRWASLARLCCTLLLVGHAISTPAGGPLKPRQGSTDAASTLTHSGAGGPTSTLPPTPNPTSQPNEQSTSGTSSTPTASPSSDHSPSRASPESTLASNSTSAAASRHASTKASHTPSPAPTNGTATHLHPEPPLPIQPRITPALSIGGVILILTGVTYCLVGVKNTWVQISLSTAYLTSLAVTVLINYVMSPPISNGIQGAYFVGIFMTGAIFGAGALIFKEVTEGFGCLFGGFCLSMWFLVLKPGGLITSQSGKGIFIAIFCVTVWSLSFSHYTRAYGLIGSTSFGGATSFVLGVDCFSRAGLKEFWFYIWGLNDNLFPLGTTSYPMTKGIRVEIIIIVLGTIIGVISQIKLWKIVRDKQTRKEQARAENERRKDVVEQALGRQLERQNDRDRANWEKQYGNTLQSKRTTILWSDAHPDKSYTHIASLERRSTSSESLKLSAFGPKRQSKLKRQSSATVDVIPEEGEDQEVDLLAERQKALTALGNNEISEAKDPVPGASQPVDAPTEVVPLPFTIPVAPDSPRTEGASSRKSGDTSMLQEPKRASKRRSFQSLLSLSPSMSPEKFPPTESQEALVLPDPLYSRPSSVAATLDEENDRAEVYRLANADSSEPPTPKIVVSPAASFDDLKTESQGNVSPKYDIQDVPPSPPALSVSFDFDPEELSRPVEPSTAKPKKKGTLGADVKEKRLSKDTKFSVSDSGVKQSSDSYANSAFSTGQTSASEVLTKGALKQVPSQHSNVVLTYRTNEWAKHISTADTPVFDEPDAIGDVEDEAPTQLAPPPAVEPSTPTVKSMDSSRTLSASSKPPAPHVIASDPGAKVVANVEPPQRSQSDHQIETASSRVAPARAASAQPVRPSSSKGKRSSIGTGAMKPSLASTTIDENAPAEFVVQEKSRPRTATAGPRRVLSGSSLVGPNKVYLSRPTTAHNKDSNSLNRTNSYTSVDDSILRLSRSSTVLSNAPALRSETRLGAYESRQPQQRDQKSEAQRREQLMADWRISQQQSATTKIMPKVSVDARRAQMLLDKEHKKLMEDQERANHQQRQFQIEQVMRRADMQDLHREAMKKMQASASKKP